MSKADLGGTAFWELVKVKRVNEAARTLDDAIHNLGVTREAINRMAEQVLSRPHRVTCEFCGRDARDSFLTVIGPKVSICDSCAFAAQGAFMGAMRTVRMPWTL
jgi:hypothetical protein